MRKNFSFSPGSFPLVIVSKFESAKRRPAKNLFSAIHREPLRTIECLVFIPRNSIQLCNKWIGLLIYFKKIFHPIFFISGKILDCFFEKIEENQIFYFAAI